ncbi:MAG: tetratricopeptide repeat protein, partial [Cyclobacteriaceae bacterium]
AALKKHLLTSLERTHAILDKDDENIEGIFFAMAINSWLAQFYDEDGSTFKALGSAKRAYTFMKKGFDLTDKSPEFYFSTGLYNSYRVQYPESNPVYKPFMWFFRSGDKALGIKQLKIASQRALFTKSEAAMYLAHLFLRYEKDPISALTYSRSLINNFPKNPVFKVNHVEALLEAKRYADAQSIIENLLRLPQPFFRMSAEIFHGMYLEKHLKDLTKAKAFYLKGIETGTSLGDKAENRLSFAYAGLARISHKEGDQDQALTYYKKASKLAQYRTIKEEAKAYQNAN